MKKWVWMEVFLSDKAGNSSISRSCFFLFIVQGKAWCHKCKFTCTAFMKILIYEKLGIYTVLKLDLFLPAEVTFNVLLFSPFPVAQAHWCPSHYTPYAEICSLVWRINAGFHSEFSCKAEHVWAILIGLLELSSHLHCILNVIREFLIGFRW